MTNNNRPYVGVDSVVEGLILESDNPLTYVETGEETELPPYDGVDAGSLNGHTAAEFLLKTEAQTLYAPASHIHTTAQVSGLDSALAGKAARSHTHSISQISNLQSTLNGKASSSHTHSASNITGGTFDGTVKADSGISVGTQAVRNIYAGTSDIGEGASLSTGVIYLVYE